MGLYIPSIKRKEKSESLPDYSWFPFPSPVVFVVFPPLFSKTYGRHIYPLCVMRDQIFKEGGNLLYPSVRGCIGIAYRAAVRHFFRHWQLKFIQNPTLQVLYCVLCTWCTNMVTLPPPACMYPSGLPSWHFRGKIWKICCCLLNVWHETFENLLSIV